ncbi:K(+)/H(+) antiporter [Yamadazyma tenuis]|uniref:K(+)/H(+) antiporter n=1 Tax=Candida tenuis TaxID=2315449 RepID=UPI0027A88D5C|nr:K(+)/H(+) antiporter [Yamadazyma tenuis]
MVTTGSVGGVIAGLNPLEYSSSSPYTIFIFQAIFILTMCNLVHFPIKYLQQPRVIAEVIAGILLGPTVLGRIPNFTDNCFPTESIPGLTLMANIGIILFLFMVGMEVDLGYIRKHLKAAVTVGLVNMAVPFGLGCAISVGMYHRYRENADLPPIKFTTYMVFIAVAMCITAFPVLARILTELNLISDRVGTIVLAAGITNDLVGWILLALAVILANSSAPVTTVYILLATAAWFVVMFIPVRRALSWYLRRFTNDLVTGEPSQFSMMLILLLVFVSAFYTNIIGVHAIFGAFMVGVIVPRDNGYVIRITEKLEDLVHLLMIPLYFAVAGLNVNLGLLNEGVDWGYTIGIIVLAMVGKIAGGFVAAKFNKLLWRESLAVGVLMSCKGIVEIVVLNVGLNAQILTQKTYSMFIVMALVTTFLTTPLTLRVYPLSYREKVAKFLKGEIAWDGTSLVSPDSAETKKSFRSTDIKTFTEIEIPRTLVLLKSIEALAPLMSFIEKYLKNSNEPTVQSIHLRDFSSRTSHLLEASTMREDNQSMEYSTSVLDLFRIFSHLLGFHTTSKSILTTPKNQMLILNEQVQHETELLLTCDKASNVLNTHIAEDNENSENALYRKIFKSAECNFGLFLKASSEGSVDTIEKTDNGTLFEHEPTSTFGVNVVISNDNSLTPSDFLALHTAFQLAVEASSVNLIIKSSSQSVGMDDELEALFKDLVSDVTITRVKQLSTFSDEVLRIKPSFKSDIFVVANNLSIESSNVLSADVAELVVLGEEEGFDTLVVKCPM